MEFTYDAYVNMIELLIEQGYSICNYTDYASYAMCAILRHDVDESIEKSLHFAELEHRIGVQSTYFILLSTDLYNAASARNIKMIHEIKRMGHSIGLHFDEAKYPSPCIYEAVKKEAYMLSLILEIPISSVSMHRPSKQTLEANYDFTGLVNSYSKTFFEGFKYVSDSRRHWREPVLDIIKSGEYNRLHILTHPFWYNERNVSPSQACAMFIESAARERYVQMSENIRNFSEFVSEGNL